MLVDGLPASGTGFLGRLANRNIGGKTPSGTLTLDQAPDQQPNGLQTDNGNGLWCDGDHRR
jgi:hypothetical protein